MKQDAGVGFAAKGFLPRSYGSIQFTHPGTCYVDQIIEGSSDMDRGFHRFGRGKNPLEPVDIGARSEANVSIMSRRYGLESKLARTCQISHSSPNCAHAKASDVPHWPAPVSVVSFLMPALAL